MLLYVRTWSNGAILSAGHGLANIEGLSVQNPRWGPHHWPNEEAPPARSTRIRKPVCHKAMSLLLRASWAECLEVSCQATQATDFEWAANSIQDRCRLQTVGIGIDCMAAQFARQQQPQSFGQQLISRTKACSCKPEVEL